MNEDDPTNKKPPTKDVSNIVSLYHVREKKKRKHSVGGISRYEIDQLNDRIVDLEREIVEVASLLTRTLRLLQERLPPKTSS